MTEHKSSRRKGSEEVPPGRAHWWWRASRIKQTLGANPQLDHFFHWKVKGRKSPRGAAWTVAERKAIETALWLYELDARISHRFLFGKPAHLLKAEQLTSVVEFAWPMKPPTQKSRAGRRRGTVEWAWIEYLDKRNDKSAPKLTRTELNGIIAAMRFCLEYFVRT